MGFLKFRPMLKKFSKILVFLIYILLTSVYAQEMRGYFDVSIPESIPVNSDFSVSIVTQLHPDRFEEVILNVYTNSGISLKNAVLNSADYQHQLTYLADLSDRFKNKNSVQIPSSELGITESFSQIILQFGCRGIIESEIGFSIEYKNNDTTEKHFTSIDAVISNEDMSVYPVKFYQPDDFAGNAALLQPDASLSLQLSNLNIGERNFLISSWIKLNRPLRAFLEILNPVNNDTLLSLSTNNFKFLNHKSTGLTEEFNEIFISPNTWIYLTIEFTKDLDINVYLNNATAAKIYLPEIQNLSSILLQIYNQTDNRKFLLDNLRALYFSGDIQDYFRQKNRKILYLQDAEVVYTNSIDARDNLNFDSEDIRTTSRNIVLVESDAPLFSQAPLLSVNVYNNFISLEWKSIGEIKNIKEYVVEKATSGNDFVEIYRTQASSSEGRYYYSDAKNVSDVIILYRVKQINKNSNSVYSAPVKIGRGDATDFEVHQNYPNPFNPITKISVEVLVDGEFQITVYDIVGERVAELHSGFLSKGIYDFEFNGAGLPSGIYFYEIKSNLSSKVRKMILAK
ncbi:MAG: T9SS type A sorting domain-containing protein [Melioribacteraceae bacterium]|nr:T9SS type A sorting domain-containing protein [Melioribacteraceae bacterium]